MASPSRDSARLARRGRVPLPSRRLIALLLIVGAIAAVVPILPPLGAVWVALLALICAGMAIDLALRPPRGSVRADRGTIPLQHSGRSGSYTLTFRNETDRFLRVAWREVLPPALSGEGTRGETVLRPFGELSREVSFIALDRGTHSIPPMGLRLSHPLGLLEYQETVPAETEVAVSPGRPAAELNWLLTRAALIEEIGSKRSRRRGISMDFESLRDYVPGDETRFIDWKASSRRNRPQLRLFQSERNAEVILAIDCGRLMGGLIDGVSKLDLAMTPFLDIAAVALERNDRVGLLAFDSRPRAFLPPRAGLQQLHAILRSLAALPRASEPTSFLRAVRHVEARHRKRAFILFFTDFTDELSAREMYASLAALTRRHVLLFIAVGDPHLERIFEHSTGDGRALFEKAVAGQLLMERRRVLAGLERLGIHTLDAEPLKLSGPLIRKFLEVRLAGVM
jgi:uncharacterized protein (DUF58 family)